MSTLNAESIQRIVIRGTNWVGDAVMTIPALRELRRVFPGAHVTLVTRPWAKELFADVDFIDKLLVYDRTGLRSVLSQVGEWRKREFDLAILFQNAFEAALIPALARVPFRIGYATERRGFLLTHAVALPEWRSSRHEVFYYLNLIREIDQIFTGRKRALEEYHPETSLRINAARKAEAQEFLRNFGVTSDRQIVALCPGSINSRAKRWPAQSFAKLGDSLIENHVDVLLIGAAEEAEVSQEVATLMRHKPIILTGKTSLTQLVEVLDGVDLLVTNDTGPAHIAAALERPTLVIFGPTNPLTTRPFSNAAEVLREPPECAPCMLRDCPIDHRCMTAITPESVFTRAQGLLTTISSRETRPTGAVA